MDRFLRVVDPDVHVHAEDQLLAGDEPQRRDQIAVARAGDHALVLPHREGVGSGRSDPQVLAGRRLGHLLAERSQLLCSHGRARAGIG